MASSMGLMLGPNMGFGFPTTPMTSSGRGNDPRDYWNVSMPSAGTSFGLGMTSTSSGLKRPRLTGELNDQFESWATESLGKRRRLEPSSDVVGYTTAQQDNRDFAGSTSAGVDRIARSFGFSSNMLNKNHLSTIGFTTNPTVPGNETHLISMSGYETPGEYDLVIMRNQLNSEDQILRYNQAEDFLIDSSKKYGFTLSGFNRYLASLQYDQGYTSAKAYIDALIQREVSRQKAFNNRGSKEAIAFFEKGEWDHASDIWRFFHLGGIVDSEVFDQGQSSVTTHEYGTNQSNRKKDVKVNLIKYGRAQVVGLAPPKKRSGANVFLITKKVMRVGQYRTDTTHELSHEEMEFARGLGVVPLVNNPPGGNRLVAAQYIWQVIPWVSGRTKRPTLKDLEWYDPLGRVHYGSAQFVGIVNKENHTDDQVEPYVLATNLSVARAQTPLDFIYTAA